MTVLVLAVASTALFGLSAPVAAQDLKVDIKITFEGQDQSCTDGSDKLISSAFPFDVEVCFSQGGSPLAGHDISLEIAHGDGSMETLTAVTDADGQAKFPVVPRSAGTTTATIRDAADSYGSVELQADDGPPPVETPYTPTGVDVGPTEEVTDGEGDVLDPFLGGSAGPDVLETHQGGMDISSFSYAGIVDGRATFNVNLTSDASGQLDQSPQSWQIEIGVATPDGTTYFLRVFLNADGVLEGEGFTANQGLVTDLEVTFSEDGKTVIISTSGVDVPPGSAMSVFARVSFDEESGVFDEAMGTAVAAAPTPEAPTKEPEPTETPEPTEESETDDGGLIATDADPPDTTSTPPDSTDSDGFPILPIVGGLGLLGVLSGGFWRWLRQDDPTDLVSIPSTISNPRDDKAEKAAASGGKSSPPRIARPPKRGKR